MAQFDIIEQLRLLDTIGGGGTDVLGRAPATPMTNSITPVPGLAEQQQPQNDVLAQLLPESAKLSKTSAITNSLADAINGLLAVSQGRSPGPSNTQRALQQKQEQLNNEFIAKQRQAQEATRKGERAEDRDNQLADSDAANRENRKRDFRRKFESEADRERDIAMKGERDRVARQQHLTDTFGVYLDGTPEEIEERIAIETQKAQAIADGPLGDFTPQQRQELREASALMTGTKAELQAILDAGEDPDEALKKISQTIDDQWYDDKVYREIRRKFQKEIVPVAEKFKADRDAQRKQEFASRLLGGGMGSAPAGARIDALAGRMLGGGSLIEMLQGMARQERPEDESHREMMLRLGQRQRF